MPKIITTKRICFSCGSDKTYNYKGFNQWHLYGDFVLCQKCKSKLCNVYKNPRRLWCKGKRFLLDENPKTGYCSWCSNNIYDKSCKKTHIHHIKYDENNPLENTVELCVSCHTKESIRLGQFGKNIIKRITPHI